MVRYYPEDLLLPGEIIPRLCALEDALNTGGDRSFKTDDGSFMMREGRTAVSIAFGVEDSKSRGAGSLVAREEWRKELAC